MNALLFITTIILVIMDWNNRETLFFVSLLAYLTAWYGYRAGEKRSNYWRLKQTAGAIGSYIGVISAIFITVDSQLYRSYDSLIWWFIPIIIGAVLIGWLMNHFYFEIEDHHGLHVKNE